MLNGFLELDRQLHGRVLLPTDDDYDRARRLWNSMFNRFPLAIAQCEGQADVQRALAFARKEGLPITVRGGGHDVTGKALIDDAFAIDLSPMRGVTVNAQQRVGTVQAGCRWRIVDQEAQVHGLAMTAGTVSDTGVAGLTLGGGIGWLMRKFGATVDHVRAIEAITVDGEPVRISQDSEPELFWGMRGAGANFAIATSFEFDLHPVGPVVHGGLIAYDGARTREVLAAWRDYMDEAPDDLGSGVNIMRCPVAPLFPAELHGKNIVVLIMTYVGPPDQADEVFAPLRKLGPIADSLGPMSYAGIQQLLEKMRPWRERFYEKGGYIPDLSDDFIDTVVAANDDGPYPVQGMQGTPVTMLMKMGGAIDRVDDNAMAFSRKNASYFWDASATWQSPSDDSSFRDWSRGLARALKPFTASESYINFTAEDNPEWLRGAYGPEKYDRLVALKDQWDPQNVLRHNRNIAPSAEQLVSI
jgi:FAD/FMN-containing dehydrogenase